MSSTPLPGAQRKATRVEPEEHNQRTQPEEHTQRTQIVLLPSDESALDLFASESDRLDVPAPSPAAGPAQLAIASTAGSIPDQTIEPFRAPAIETIRDYPIDPIEDYQIDSARNIAIEPIRQYVRHGSMHTPGTTLLHGCAIFVGLALGVFGGGLAGFYLRRNPIELAIIRLPVADAANQATIAGPTPETASPGTTGDAGTAPVNEARTIPSERASTLTETPVPAPPLAATENLSPPVPPAPMPPPRIDPLTTAGGATSPGERSDGGEAPSPSQTIPSAPGGPVEAPVVPSAAADPATPDAGTPATTDRVRVTDATPGIAAAADEQRIAAVLKRFTDAYTQLNAPAAKTVWPSVDGRALSRAFDALESQSIEFDDCTVHFAGAEARAACVGNITSVPKIGRRSARTVNRQWNFVMKRNSDGWMIADARMR